jgi:hypothetical protein
MSEVHRYRAVKMLSEDGNCINYNLRGPEVVLATSFDRVNAELHTLMGAGQSAPFQSRVKPWMLECFGEVIAADRQERNHRFLEEALELVQACGCKATEAHQLVEYVYGRPAGEQSQEVGGVMVTLAALCLAGDLDMHAAGEDELARIWTKVEQIRAKQAAKPAMSPLPGAYPDRERPAPVAVVLPERRKPMCTGAISDFTTFEEARGWNACLDELKRLNPSL